MEKSLLLFQIFHPSSHHQDELYPCILLLCKALNSYCCLPLSFCLGQFKSDSSYNRVTQKPLFKWLLCVWKFLKYFFVFIRDSLDVISINPVWTRTIYAASVTASLMFSSPYYVTGLIGKGLGFSSVSSIESACSKARAEGLPDTGPRFPVALS